MDDGMFRLFENLARYGWMVECFEKSPSRSGGWYVRMSRGHLGEMAFGLGAYPEDALENALDAAQKKEIRRARQ